MGLLTPGIVEALLELAAETGWRDIGGLKLAQDSDVQLGAKASFRVGVCLPRHQVGVPVLEHGRLHLSRYAVEFLGNAISEVALSFRAIGVDFADLFESLLNDGQAAVVVIRDRWIVGRGRRIKRR